MFWALVSLFVLVLVVRLAVWAVKAFMAWLGRGKPVRRAREMEDTPDDVREALRAVEAYDMAKETRKAAGKRPHINRQQRAWIRGQEHLLRDDYLEHMRLGWYQIVIIFVVGSVGGLVLEEVWMFITAGLTQSRVGLVWGPFSPLYGFGCVFLTIICFELRRHGAKWWQVFLIAMLMGGLLEQVTGWAMETFMGAVSWDYSNVPGHLTKWVSLPFLFFWGLLGVVWDRFITPWLLWTIGEPTTQRQVAFVLILAIYLALDIFMTLACFSRRAARDAGIPPANAFEEWVDEHYSNEFMSERFQNMVIGS